MAVRSYENVSQKLTVKQIHKLVFSNFTYKTDKEQYGKPEYWVQPDSSYTGHEPVIGDCEDFVLACRKLCDDNGFMSRLVFCKTELDEGHLVLEVHGSILDNRMTRVVTNTYLERKGYTFISISGYEPGDSWRKLI